MERIQPEIQQPYQTYIQIVIDTVDRYEQVPMETRRLEVWNVILGNVCESVQVDEKQVTTDTIRQFLARQGEIFADQFNIVGRQVDEDKISRLAGNQIYAAFFIIQNINLLIQLEDRIVIQETAIEQQDWGSLFPKLTPDTVPF